MSLDERMRLVVVILKELGKGPLSWTELEKGMLSGGGSHWKFTVIMGWLADKGFIAKLGPSGSRAPYVLNLEKVRFEDGGLMIKL